MEGLEKLFISQSSKEIVIEFEGAKIPISIKEMSWSRKSQILSQCLIYGDNGKVSFNYDLYNKLMIKEIIVVAPWGETNEIFLNQVKSSFGQELEKLIPKAFDDIKSTDFLAKGLAK